MAKADYGMATGKCTVCTINLWDSTNNKPTIFPCGIEKCPYEDANNQNAHLGIRNYSGVGSGLGQIIFNG